jgi:Bardet-Biedl syndrome 7 protein
LQVLPKQEDGRTQRIALGDLQGVVQCVGVKKGELLTAFKTLPALSGKVRPLRLG